MSYVPYSAKDDVLGDALEHPTGETCQACRKRSDACLTVRDVTLCGTHFDEYLHGDESVHEFTARLRTTRYAACWAAQEE